MPSYTVYCSRVDAKTFGWASMISLSQLSFLGVKVPTQEKGSDKGIPKCSGRRNSVGSGEEAKAVKQDMNLISELNFL